jgi:long-chain acyl-CoA synthetase
MLDQPGIFITEAVSNHARLHGASVAVTYGTESLTWKELDERINQTANALRDRGLQTGTKVALIASTSLESFVLLWGTIRAGGVIVPLNVMMARQAIPLMVENCEARFVFVDKAHLDVVGDQSLCKRHDRQYFVLGAEDAGCDSGAELMASGSTAPPSVELSMSDSISIIYSSGTTGVPKGIEHSHLARHLYTLGCGPAIGMTRDSVAVCATPLYTNGTWQLMLPALFLGGKVALMSKFSGKEFLNTVQTRGGTHSFLVPTQLIKILATPDLASYDCSSLRVILSGGAPLLAQTAEEMARAFPELGLCEIYGITEGFITISTPADTARGKARSVGTPVFGGDVRILGDDDRELPAGQTGEIVGWSPALMKGYYRDHARTEEMIWRSPEARTYLRSGDVGHLDEDGYLYVSGRKKDMIISGGINVFASDIEDVFLAHPAVEEVAAIGIPHDTWGETPLLLAVLKKDCPPVTEDELRAWGNERLGKFQRVSAVEFRTDFPRATHDKVLKRALRTQYWPSADESA